MFQCQWMHVPDWRCHSQFSHRPSSCSIFSHWYHVHTLHFTLARLFYVLFFYSLQRNHFLSILVEIQLRLRSPTQWPGLAWRFLVACCMTHTWLLSPPALCYCLCSYIILSPLHSELDPGRSQMSTFLLSQQCTGPSWCSMKVWKTLGVPSNRHWAYDREFEEYFKRLF